MNHKALLRKAHAAGIGHGFINYWVGAMLETLEEFTADKVIAEFGAIGTEFLQLVYLESPYHRALISTLPGDDPARVRERAALNPQIELQVVPHSQMNSGRGQIVDIGYAFEVFSLVEDLPGFAQQCFDSLSEHGAIYATFAWHQSNPLSERTKELREGKGRPFFSYSIDDIVEAFRRTGFEVALKRLPMPYFLVCHEPVVNRRYGSVEAMVRSGYEQLYLFSFRKVHHP